MRVLLDTNVLIAAFIARGTCSELFEYCAVNHTLISAEPLLNEFKTTLRAKLGFSVREIREAVAILKSRVEIVEAPQLDSRVCRDPDDDRVLAAALAGGCDCIVTGDKDLLVIESFRGIPIVAPGAFWKNETP